MQVQGESQSQRDLDLGPPSTSRCAHPTRIASLRFASPGLAWPDLALSRVHSRFTSLPISTHPALPALLVVSDPLSLFLFLLCVFEVSGQALFFHYEAAIELLPINPGATNSAPLTTTRPGQLFSCRLEPLVRYPPVTRWFRLPEMLRSAETVHRRRLF